MVSSLSSQLESLKFISEGSTKRKEILAKFLDLEIFDTKDKIAKEESSMLEGKIKHLESRSEDYEQDIAEAQENIATCTSSVNEQQKICNVLAEEMHEITRDMMKIETRLESTPVQKVIDVDSVRQSVDSTKSDISTLNARNQELQVEIDSIDSIVQKIDEFIETFNYSSWKEKKQEIVDLRAELTEANSNLSLAEREKRSLYEKKTLLQQVPCGSEYSHCRFIRSAYEKIEEEADIETRHLSLRNSREGILVKIEELEPDTVEKYLSQYDEILQKRRDKKGALAGLELEIAKNKTTIVKLRDSLAKFEEELRLFEENEKVIIEFAAPNQRETGARQG